MSIANSIRAQIPPIHPEGYPFIGGFALASLILFWIWTPLGWIGTILTVWCALFFRDPVRVTPVREGIVVAPADGRISMITHVLPPAELGLGDRPLPREFHQKPKQRTMVAFEQFTERIEFAVANGDSLATCRISSL